MGPVAVGLLLGLVAMAPAEAGKQPWVEGDQLEFRLPDLTGQWVSSSDARFEGKVVLIDLWGTWCPPCLSEIPTLIDLQSRLGDRGLVVVAIAFEAEADAEARRKLLREFVGKRGIDYLVLDGGTTDEFETALPAVRNVTGLPVEILVDRSGTVVDARNSYGFKKRWARRLEREIAALLGEEVE